VRGVKLGSDRVEELAGKVEGRRVGVVTNHTGYNSQMTHTLDLLREHCSVEVVFTPEHGLYGAAGPGERVESYLDTELGVRVLSLYGDRYEPPSEELSGLDLVVYDIQDLGLRWYTYISTLYYMVRGCAGAGIPLLVLDRPAPLTGVRTEGPVLEPRFRSFVGVSCIPARYALTPGELALYFSKFEGLGGEVDVLGMSGWDRRLWHDQTGLPWIPPSPNIPSLDAAIAYAGACLLEGTNLSEGRGTASPFQQFGAPWIEPRRLATELNSMKLPGAVFRPVKFVPASGRYAGEVVGGAYLHVIDREAFKPFTAFSRILRKVHDLYGEKLALARWDGGYAVDYLAGTDSVRRYVLGELELEDLELEWRVQRARFAERARQVVLYEGAPAP